MTDKKIALITGAANGIGKAIAKKLSQENIFIVAADTDEPNLRLLSQELGEANATISKTDISLENQVLDLFTFLSDNFHRIDILVNNAGIIRDSMIHNMSIEDFDNVIGVNLRGTWLMCREAAKIMRKQKHGRIVNISSRAWLGNPGQSNYSASKAGIIGLTRVLALELGKYNVLVNSVAPGLIDTPLTRSLPQDVLKKLTEAQPTKSMGLPEDVANAVFFLVNENNHFISGQTIYVDGGKSIGANLF
jgi:NAD(P)-dependent dehydrogenase (short-subunit alcohol dehydrogenase family)